MVSSVGGTVGQVSEFTQTTLTAGGTDHLAGPTNTAESGIVPGEDAGVGEWMATGFALCIAAIMAWSLA